MKLFETNKLHYGKYLYKLCVTTPLAGIFRTELQRSGKLSYAKSKLDSLVSNPIISRWKHDIRILPEDLLDASSIYKILKNEKNYLIRCEYNTLSIFSNDKTVLLKIAKKINSVTEFWEPKKSMKLLLETEQNIIIVKHPPEFLYKVTFNRKIIKSEVSIWIEKNPDKVRAGSILLYNIENNISTNGQYIYVKDEKVMLLLELMLGQAIRRIDKLVCVV